MSRNPNALYESDYKILAFLTEVYSRSKDNFTKMSEVFKGNSKKYPSSLAHQFGISKIYTSSPLIELNFIETYTDSNYIVYVKWVGKRPTFDHVNILKNWNKRYAEASKERVRKRKETLSTQTQIGFNLPNDVFDDSFLDDRSFNLNKIIDQITLIDEQVFEMIKQKTELFNQLRELLNQKEYS